MDKFEHLMQIGANIATIIGAIGVIFLFGQHYYNKDIRNLQLMHRCIDRFREWSLKEDPKIDLFYMELLNEELFYFQNDLIQRKIAIEWLEGILDYIQIFSKNGTILTAYNSQQDIETLIAAENKSRFFNRICFFVHPDLDNSYIVPGPEDKHHAAKKRALAIQLYTHIRKYGY